MSQKPRRTFTDEQKPEVVKIVEDSGKPIPLHYLTYPRYC